MLLNLFFAKNIILSCFFLIINLYFLILEAIAQIFNSNAEKAIPTGAPTKEAKAEIETHPISVEAKIDMCLI